MAEANVYREFGYKDRSHYLRSLSRENGVPYDAVVNLAELLGPSEDFDGLVTQVEDYGDSLRRGCKNCD